MRPRLMARGWWTIAVMLAIGCATLPRAAQARHGDSGDDRVAIFSTIEISEERPAADVACAFCTVKVDGPVHGDLAVIFSTVSVSDGQTISGDVATLFSTLVLGEGARINGDLATALGTTSLAETAQVGGDKAILASGLGLMVLVPPILITIGVIWLLVWGIRRLVG